MDKDYWENYYANHRIDLKPSLFAKFVLGDYLEDSFDSMIELGCGNGRDSIFIAKEDESLNVLGVDQVEQEINFLNDQYDHIENLTFQASDFTALGDEGVFDLIYSRFTLHSINAAQQERVLNWAYQSLNEEGLLCIEVRGKKNELYEKGARVAGEPDAYIFDDHYRRFVDFDQLCSSLESLGFVHEFAEESKGFAPYKGTDETFIRVISRKN